MKGYGIVFSVGYWGVPGKVHTSKVHVRADGKTLCGSRPHGEFQWCSSRLDFLTIPWISCRKCARIAREYRRGILQNELALLHNELAKYR